MKSALWVFILAVGALSIPCISHAKSQSCCATATGESSGSEPEVDAPGSGVRGNQSSATVSDRETGSKSGTAPHQVLGEVIVTAQKRRQQAFDVPISLVVVGSPELQQRQISNLSDLQFAVPGLFVQSNDAQRRIQLNGVSNPNGNGAFVSEYVDEADITPQGFSGNFGYGNFDSQTYDLERVEVLRGPQGTLYGEGAMGGTLRFITNKPVLDRFQVDGDTSALFTEDGEPSQRFEAVLNAPLVMNTLGLRFAGEVEHDGGWIDEPVGNLNNINRQNVADGRVEGLWEPSAQFRVSMTQIIHRSSYGLNSGEDASGNFTPTFDLTVAPRGEENFNVSNVTMTYDVHHVQLLSSTTYFDHSLVTDNYMQVLPYLSGVVYDVDYPRYPVGAKDLSQELRLANTAGGAWQWTVGGYYKHYKDEENYSYYFGNPGPLSMAPLFPFVESELSKSWSVFADSSYKLFDRLTIGVGARYFKDDEDFVQNTAARQRASFTSNDPRVYVQYQLTEQVNTYASAAKGFRSGGFNNAGRPAYGPEQVWTYEAGIKTRSFRDRLSIDADVFVTDYSRYVVTGFLPAAPGLSYSRNAGDARIKGAEADIEWRPVGWEFELKGDYLDAKFVALTALGTGFTVGERLPFVSKYMFTGSAQRDFSWNSKETYVRVDYSQVGPQQYQYLGGPLQMSDVIHMVNASVGIQWNDNVTLSVFAQNLLNDRGFLDATPLQHLAARSRPRTLGLEMAVRFD